MYVLKSALDESMRTSDDEQGINKLWPNRNLFRLVKVLKAKFKKRKTGKPKKLNFTFCELYNSGSANPRKNT